MLPAPATSEPAPGTLLCGDTDPIRVLPHPHPNACAPPWGTYSGCHQIWASRPLCSSRGAASGSWVSLHIFVHFKGLMGTSQRTGHVWRCLRWDAEATPSRTLFQASQAQQGPLLLEGVLIQDCVPAGNTRLRHFSELLFHQVWTQDPPPAPRRGSLEMEPVTCGDPLSIFQ